MRVNCQLVDAFIAVELNENKNRRRIFRSEMFERVNVTFFASRKIFGSLTSPANIFRRNFPTESGIQRGFCCLCAIEYAELYPKTEMKFLSWLWVCGAQRKKHQINYIYFIRIAQTVDAVQWRQLITFTCECFTYNSHSRRHHHVGIDSPHQHWVNHTSCTFGKATKRQATTIDFTCIWLDLYRFGDRVFNFIFFRLFFAHNCFGERQVHFDKLICSSSATAARYRSHGTAETITWSPPLATTIKH